MNTDRVARAKTGVPPSLTGRRAVLAMLESKLPDLFNTPDSYGLLPRDLIPSTQTDDDDEEEEDEEAGNEYKPWSDLDAGGWPTHEFHGRSPSGIAPKAHQSQRLDDLQLT